MNRQARSRLRRSFTLLEVLIALALGIALLGSVFTFYFNVLKNRERLLERSDEYRAATTLIDRLEAELAVCVAGHRRRGEGVHGDEHSLTVASRSVAASLAERGMLDPAVFSDLQVTQYRFDASTRRLRLTRWVAGHEDTRTSETITEQLARVRFRYYDGARWRDSFDSIDADALPHAVEIAIWFEPFSDDQPMDAASESAREAGAPVREAFNAERGFDEFEFAMRDNRGFDDEPLPDRYRIISIPDAAAEDVLSAEAAGAEASP
jgi:type II secretory pathway component PulJ